MVLRGRTRDPVSFSWKSRLRNLEHERLEHEYWPNYNNMYKRNDNSNTSNRNINSSSNDSNNTVIIVMLTIVVIT